MIDFFKPIETAWVRMEKCLFKPFDISKWFVLGFSAWLASFFDGGYSNFNFGNPAGESDKSKIGHDTIQAVEHAFHWNPVVVGVVAIVLVLILAVILVFYWLGCRGQFMFLDNLVHNRAEVVKPWAAYRVHGDSLFVFGGVILLVALFVTLGLSGMAVAYFWKDISLHHVRAFAVYAPWIVLLVGVVLGWIVLGIYIFFLTEFGIPMMYHHGDSAWQASKRIWQLGSAKPVDFFVYLLLRMVMGLLFMMLACVVGCFTCCLGFFPYLSSVITLPLRVFRVSYTLDCLSQLAGENYWPPEELPPAVPASTLV